MIDPSRLNTFLLVERFKWNLFFRSIRASNSRGMGVVSRHLHIPFQQRPRKYLTLSLGWIINQEKFELKPTILPGFSPCKTLSERWLNLQDLILHLKVKTCFDCKMFVADCVAPLNGENGLGGST